MSIQLFNALFILAMIVILIIPVFIKLKNYKTPEEWEEIKRQNYSKMETTSKQDPDKQS